VANTKASKSMTDSKSDVDPTGLSDIVDIEVLIAEKAVYDHHSRLLIERGLCPLPIVPNDLAPSIDPERPPYKAPAVHVGNGLYKLLVGWQTAAPITVPQPGAGIGVRTGDKVVGLDIDTDDPVIGAELVAAFPPSPVSKWGARGQTILFRAPAGPAVPSRKFTRNGQVVVEVLATGRQTVLPPTVHPVTNRPYEWGNGATLYNTDAAQLPEWPADATELIHAVLEVYGGEPKMGMPPPAEDSPFKDLNVNAQQQLDLWVQDLGLQKLSRARGRSGGWQAVAHWRPSSAGRDMAARQPNLKINRKAIHDFGDGRSYSPLDLVMAAKGVSLSEATAWLEERLHRDEQGPDIDFEALGAKPEEPREDAGTKARSKKPGRFQFTPSWEMKPGAEEAPYLVDELIPQKGVVLLWGPPKCLKSFFLLDVMWHIAKGWEYRDRAVQQGTVMYCAFEGAHGYRKRIEALRRHHKLIDGTDRTPVHIMQGRTDLIRDHSLLVSEVRGYLGDVRPACVVLDTLNKSLVGSESKDIDMAAYIRAAEAVRDAFDCVVVIVHHCGWNEERMRGHSSLRGAVDAEIKVTRDGDIVAATVEEMRDGPDGVEIWSTSKQIEVGQDASGRPLTSLVIVPHESGGAEVSQGKEGGGGKWPKALRVFRDALARASTTVRAVELGPVREEFYALYVAEADGGASPQTQQDARRQAFWRAVKQAQERGLIGARAYDDGRQLIWPVHLESYAF
jgi:hypothetical protein